MTKVLPLDSIENGIRQAIRSLGDQAATDALARFTGQRKSASLLRKCADPDDNRHNIQLRDAVAYMADVNGVELSGGDIDALVEYLRTF